MTAILALSAAVVYGTADFFGGVAARRTSPLAVTLSAHVVGLILLVLAIPMLPTAAPQPGDLVYGGLAGAFGAGGLILFYRALSRGTMSVVAPVAALFGAALPVVVGVGLGEQLSVPALAGIAIAIVAVGLVSREGEPPPTAGGPTAAAATPLVLAVIAGAAFGAFFVLFSRTSASRRSVATAERSGGLRGAPGHGHPGRRALAASRPGQPPPGGGRRGR